MHVRSYPLSLIFFFVVKALGMLKNNGIDGTKIFDSLKFIFSIILLNTLTFPNQFF